MTNPNLPQSRALLPGALLADPALMLAYDETASRAGQASIIAANIPTAHVSIVANGFGKLIANGLL